MSQIPFLVETARILEILSKQIYDSPYAMVRENVQNAYDAILMRAKREDKPASEYAIEVTATAERIEIRDNGIGMSEVVLRENFWRAGSSGKNNAEARAAGVIGTFGIGAMANFGVCEYLQVETREVGNAVGIRTSARKSQLSIGENCIELERVESGIEEGTRLCAEIGAATRVDVASLRNYIHPFVRFLAVPLRLNGELLSGGDPRSASGIGAEWALLEKRPLQTGRFAFDASVLAEGSRLGVVVENLSIDGEPCTGGLWLVHQGGQVMGLRSRFGLAPVPMPSLYQLGGFADLPFLFPTAGREALTRESIQEAAQLMPAIESALTEIIRDTELADSLAAFQQHVMQSGQTAWAGRVSVQLSLGDRRLELQELPREFPQAEGLLWYAGADAATIATFSSEDRPLVRVSQSNPRRELQIRYLRDVLRWQAVPDTATVLETYESTSLSWDEVTLMLAIARVLKADYLIDQVQIEWVKISHGVPMLAELSGERLVLRVARTWSAVQAVLQVISASPELVDGLTKDLVRVHIYDRIKAFVPSSQRAGLDALQKTLARRRELYRLEIEDRGELEPLLAEYLAGKVDFQEVLTVAASTAGGQTQRVGRESVGTVENVLVDVVNNPLQSAPAQPTVPVAGSPILRLDMDVRERLLITERDIPQLNNHRVFLALSDRLFQLENEFFAWPHSTQVAWAGRRIVFLFGLAQSAQSMYYDIELRGNRSAGDAGGTAVATTTIVTKNRIFVPVPQQLTECFRVTDSPVEFYVRFDLLGHK